MNLKNCSHYWLLTSSCFTFYSFLCRCASDSGEVALVKSKSNKNKQIAVFPVTCWWLPKQKKTDHCRPGNIGDSIATDLISTDLQKHKQIPSRSLCEKPYFTMFWVKTQPQVTIMFSQDLKWPSIPVNHSADLKGPGLRYTLLTSLLNLPLGFLPSHFIF